MIALSLLWLASGGLLGALAYAAAPTPARADSRGWRALALLAVIGAVAGLAGGWAGALLLGRIFGTFSAIWIAILFAGLTPVLVPHAVATLGRRAESVSPVPTATPGSAASPTSDGPARA